METSAKNKWQIRLAVVVIFVIGFAAGALAMNFYTTRYWAPSADNTRGRFDELIDKLNLSQDQKDQVKVIFDDARAQLNEVRKQSEPKFREVRKQTDERLKAVLSPEQWERFQELRAEFRQKRRPGRDRQEDRR